MSYRVEHRDDGYHVLGDTPRRVHSTEAEAEAEAERLEAVAKGNRAVYSDDSGGHPWWGNR